MMSLPSKETLESIAVYAEWLSAIFGILAAISVVVLVLVNKPLKKMAEREAADERTKAVAAHTKELEAQLKLDQWLSKRVLAREAQPKDFEYLKRFPNMHASVEYKKGDGESFMYAQTILSALAGIGWIVPVRSIPTDRHPVGLNNSDPIIGNFVLARHLPHGQDVIMQMNLPASQKSALFLLSDAVKGKPLENPLIPENEFVIVVGEHPRDWTAQW